LSEDPNLGPCRISSWTPRSGFDGIGANEFIMDVAHEVPGPDGHPVPAVDFLSMMNTDRRAEWNLWYHVLNCGLKVRGSGETDFPCIYGDRVGLGRIYVKLDEGQPLDFDAWVKGVKDGRSYCGDGLSHVLEFGVDHVAVGEPGDGGKLSTRVLDRPGMVTVACDVAALLTDAEPTPATEAIRARRLDDKPYWHLERARVGGHLLDQQIVILAGFDIGAVFADLGAGRLVRVLAPLRQLQPPDLGDDRSNPRRLGGKSRAGFGRI
jgi:hypothetical protein